MGYGFFCSYFSLWDGDPCTNTNPEAASAATWSGGGSPFAMGSKKLGMWLFITSDVLTFTALLVAYTYSRLSNPNWSRPFPFYPSIIFSTSMTIVLLFSSLTMVMAVAAANKGNRSTAVKWTIATVIGGLGFIGLHLREWIHLINEGLRPGVNPWAARRFLARCFSESPDCI